MLTINDNCNNKRNVLNPGRRLIRDQFGRYYYYYYYYGKPEHIHTKQV